MPKLYIGVMAFAFLLGCTEEDGGECKSDTECKGDRICDGGMCVDPVAGSDGDSSASASDTAQSSGGESSGGTQPLSCDESGTYCDDNILFDCTTEEVIVNCKTCQYVGPGTGSEYDTSCKAQASDCSVCNAEDPYDGPGCYFGGGPAVCKS